MTRKSGVSHAEAVTMEANRLVSGLLLLFQVFASPAQSDEIHSEQELAAHIGQIVSLKGKPGSSQRAPQGTAKLITDSGEIRMADGWPADIYNPEVNPHPVEVTVRGVLLEDKGSTRFSSKLVLEKSRIIEVKEEGEGSGPATEIRSLEDLQANIGKIVVVEGEPHMNRRQPELITVYGNLRYPYYWYTMVYDPKAPRKIHLRIRAKLIYQPEEVIQLVDPAAGLDSRGDVGERVPAGYKLASPQVIELKEAQPEKAPAEEESPK